MALDLTSTSRDWHHLVEVDLGGGNYLRVADRRLTLSDNTYWDGRVLSVSPLEQALSGILQPQFVTPSLQVTLDDNDGTIRDLLDTYAKFAGKTITYSVGQGETVADYEVRFTGQVRFPGGVSRDDQTVTLDLNNSIEADDVVLPKTRIDAATYPNAEAKSLNLPIPEILGDWRTTAGGGETVPAYQTDSTVGTGGSFTVCISGQSVQYVYKNGSSVSFTQTSTTPLKFTLNVAYTSATDTITANVQGRASALLGRDNPADMAYTLLTNSSLMNKSNVNATAFTTASRLFGAGDTCRRWIGTEIYASELLTELCSDGFMDMVLDEAGDYAVYWRLASAPASLEVYRDVDLEPISEGRRAFQVLADPEQTYVNQLVYAYRLDTDGAYQGIDQIDDTDAQTAVGQIRRRRLQLNWLYATAGADDRAAREIRAFSEEVELVSLTMGARALTLQPSDEFQLIYSTYEVTSTRGTPFMVRSVAPDFSTMTAKVLAWNIDNLTPKRYQADGSAAWGSATDYAKTYDGFYGDSSGEASPGDATSGSQFYF